MSLFENIRDRKESANIIYQDEFITAFDDKYPSAPVHILIIPNKMIKSLDDLKDEDEIYMGKILLRASRLAKIKNIQHQGVTNMSFKQQKTVVQFIDENYEPEKRLKSVDL